MKTLEGTHRAAVLTMLVIVAALGCKREPASAPADAKPAVTPSVRVAAAADLKFALDQVIVEFHKSHPNVEITPTYGASGNFFAQLSNKAPFDLYLSADVNYPKKLVEQGLADKQGVFGYARGQIVVWALKSSPIDVEKLGMRAVLDPAAIKVAVANPDHAPYGRAAVAAMKSLGVYDQVKEHLVFGENIAQTAQFIQSGSADVGIIAESLAMVPSMKEQGKYWIVPATAYPPIEQGGVVLSWAQDLDAARAFKDFLISAQGKAVLKQFGFSTSED